MANDLNQLLSGYWTEKKCGKHSNLAIEHGKLLLKDAIAGYDDIFEQLKSNVFTFSEFGKISWNEFLKRAKLSEYLKSDYVKDALAITTPRPAIGKGEFLFVSCFSNLGFSGRSGDIVDLKNGYHVEFKGNRSTLAGDSAALEYRPLSDSTFTALRQLLKIDVDADSFNREYCHEIDKALYIVPDKTEKVIQICQNLKTESNTLTAMFSKLYREKKDIMNVIAAMHLYAYLRAQRADYLLMTNDHGFCCFKAPDSAEQAYEIAMHLKVGTWRVGSNGISVSL